MQGHVHAPFRPLHSDDLLKLEVVKCGSVEMGCIMMVRERVGTLVDTLGQRYAERFGGDLGGEIRNAMLHSPKGCQTLNNFELSQYASRDWCVISP